MGHNETFISLLVHIAYHFKTMYKDCKASFSSSLSIFIHFVVVFSTQLKIPLVSINSVVSLVGKHESFI